MRTYSKNFIEAAKAAGMDPEKFAKAIRDLLSHSKCRDTRKFSFRPVAGLSDCCVVSQH